MAYSMDAQVKGILKCVVCHDRMKCPKFLPCLHTFCKECVNDVHRNRTYHTNEARCPICRQKFVLSYSGADELPDNFYFNELLENMTMQEGTKEQEQKTCARCSKENADQMCIHCNTLLCDDCIVQHNSYPEHKQHSVIKLTNLSDSDRETLLRVVQVTRKCEEHNLRPTRYCTQCKSTVCPECNFVYHKDHETVSVERVSSFKEQMEIIQRQSKRLTLDLDTELKTCEENVNSFEKDRKRVTEAIKSWFETVRQKLNEKEANMVREANSIVDNESEKESKKKTEIEYCASSLGKLQIHIDSTIRIGSDLLILSETNEIRQWMTQLQTDVTDLKEETRKYPPNMSFVANRDFLDSVNNAARIEKLDDNKEIETYSDIIGVQFETGSPESEGYSKAIHNYTEEAADTFPQYQSHRSLPGLPPTPIRIPRRSYSTSAIGHEHTETSVLYENDNPSSITFKREKRMENGTGITGLTITTKKEVIAVSNHENACYIFDNKDKYIGAMSDKLVDPFDVSTFYDRKKDRSIIFVTDHDEGKQEGYIKHFDLKKGRPGPCKIVVREENMHPLGITTTDKNHILCDVKSHMIKVYDFRGSQLRKIGGGGDHDLFDAPTYISSLLEDKFIVSDKKKKCTIMMDSSGNIIQNMNHDLITPAQAAVDDHGTIFIGNSNQGSVFALLRDQASTGYSIVEVRGDYSDIGRPVAVAVDNRNRLWVGHDHGLDIIRLQYRYTDSLYS